MEDRDLFFQDFYVVAGRGLLPLHPSEIKIRAAPSPGEHEIRAFLGASGNAREGVS
jgi:hypothetical protein